MLVQSNAGLRYVPSPHHAEETAMPEKKLTGRIAAERIKMQSTPKPPAGAVDRYLALGECTSLISDVMDELGVPEGVIGATTLKPTLPGKLIVGPALTVRNIRQRSDPLAAKTHVNRMAEFEAHNLAEDGDVLVISGVGGMSDMGQRDHAGDRQMAARNRRDQRRDPDGRRAGQSRRPRRRRRHRRLLHPARRHFAGAGAVREEKERRGRAHRGDHAGCAGAGVLWEGVNSAA